MSLDSIRSRYLVLVDKGGSEYYVEIDEADYNLLLKVAEAAKEPIGPKYRDWTIEDYVRWAGRVKAALAELEVAE